MIDNINDDLRDDNTRDGRRDGRRDDRYDGREKSTGVAADQNTLALLLRHPPDTFVLAYRLSPESTSFTAKCCGSHVQVRADRPSMLVRYSRTCPCSQTQHVGKILTHRSVLSDPVCW